MKNEVVKKIHDPVLKRRKARIAENVIRLLGESNNKRIADIGCGDGEIGLLLQNKGWDVEGFEIMERADSLIKVSKFDGRVIERENEYFDFCVLIDVLHHDENPEALLKEAAWVSKVVIIKDHLCNSLFDELVLSFMDWVGNRHHGVRLPYNYLSAKQWEETLESAGLYKDSEIKPEDIKLYKQPLELIFGGKLHILWKLKKK